MNNLEADQEIQKVIDKYFTQDFLNDKNRVHGTILGDEIIDSQLAGNILAKATYDLLKENNMDCDIVINNGSRDQVLSGEMTSEKIFNMIPFTNKTLLVKEISGNDILNECKRYSNPYYMPNPNLEITSTGKYTVACIDYMMIHKNAYRSYDYFTSYDSKNLLAAIDTLPNEIVEDYLSTHKTINTSDYRTTNYRCL